MKLGPNILLNPHKTRTAYPIQPAKGHQIYEFLKQHLSQIKAVM